MTVQLRQNAETLTAHAAACVNLRPVRGGIARGTVVLTGKGEVAVENLKVGDRVITRERGIAVIKAINSMASPACMIRADSLGLGRPERDTTVAYDQHVMLRDWRAETLFDCDVALVPARRLADGKQIAALGDTDFFRLDFGKPLTIYANGLEAPTGRTEAGVVEITDED
ncbi:Hint domain-containing protein [Jannaschia faecimaris]|uniref:Hint domain-containing protein n=1 Tax=Jannaschia faecimaris TaxID=1244108 RepID=A0A1H3TH52_9RHOB|nr:Hint domain-containing protein [Jannaschia faecimaris]SDZ49613.1 Hint domain-containing protein [Jannaschia faecimaris]